MIHYLRTRVIARPIPIPISVISVVGPDAPGEKQQREQITHPFLL
jgi:hypothetical protein